MLWIVVCALVIIKNVSSESCIYQRCLGCSPVEASYHGESVQCHPSNWVTPEWVHNLGHPPPPPPSTSSKIAVEYRCLKMFATPDDKTFGNTVDVIRGCVPRVQVDSVCLGLEAVERARGHSDARCHICKHNDCNSASQTLSLLTPVITSILFLYVFR